MMDLSSVATCDLVEALSHREGVNHIWIEPQDVKKIMATGPARILVVVD